MKPSCKMIHVKLASGTHNDLVIGSKTDMNSSSNDLAGGISKRLSFSDGLSRVMLHYLTTQMIAKPGRYTLQPGSHIRIA